MPPTTLEDLLNTFGISTNVEDGAEKTAAEDVTTDAKSAEVIKTANDGGNGMTLADLYLSMQEADGHVKEASGEVTETETTTAGTDEQALDAAAEALASQELEKEAGIKLAAEYDAAGRIMARGFFDEVQKLAAADTHVVPGANSKPSAAKTEALGERGVPLMPVNDASSPKNNVGIPTAGPGPKQVYKDVLKDGKKTSVGSGVTMSPPVVGGFATVKDITG